MMPLDMAMKLSSASAKCERHKCPFMTQCKGEYTTCTMKEIALMLRAQNAEIQTKDAIIRGLQDLLLGVHDYTRELEKINKRYHDVILAFQNGYRPARKMRGKIRRSPNKKAMKKDPTEMDGDERYAYEPPKTTEPAPPLVVI